MGGGTVDTESQSSSCMFNKQEGLLNGWSLSFVQVKSVSVNLQE